MHSPSHFTAPTNLIFNYSLTTRLMRLERKKKKSQQAEVFILTHIYPYFKKKRTKKTTGKMSTKCTQSSLNINVLFPREDL